MKIIEVIADVGHQDTIKGIAEQHGASDVWFGPENEDGRLSARLLVMADKRQVVMDALQSVLQTSENARILLIPLEVALPKLDDENGDDEDEVRNVQLLLLAKRSWRELKKARN